MSRRVQVAAFANARVVIAQHGAALSSAAYMREGTTVLEMQPVVNGVFEQVYSDAPQVFGSGTLSSSWAFARFSAPLVFEQVGTVLITRAPMH